jgi:Universal stress protein family
MLIAPPTACAIGSNEAIIDAASARRCDLIVMASHGRRGVSAVVLGSETVKVLTHLEDPRTRVSLRVFLGIRSISPASPMALGRGARKLWTGRLSSLRPMVYVVRI